MKKTLYLAAAAIAMAFASGCTKESEGLTRITYYPVLELEGDSFMVVDKGSDFQDPGFSATLNGEDVTADVDVNSNVNTSKSGVYSVKYSIVNADGFKSEATREVVVLDANDPVEGFWYSSADSFRLYNGAQTPFGREFEILIINEGDGTYYVDDLLGGWYCQRAGYGSSYAMNGYIEVDGSDITLVDSYLAGWGDCLVDWADGVIAGDTISYVATYVSGMEFHVTLTK